jgi:hypothetical protein
MGIKNGKGIFFQKMKIKNKNEIWWVLYEGDFENDKFNGQGEIKWSNGDQYKGNVVNDDKHGFGEMKWNDGTTYIGDWVKGKM